MCAAINIIAYQCRWWFLLNTCLAYFAPIHLHVKTLFVGPPTKLCIAITGVWFLRPLDLSMSGEQFVDYQFVTQITVYTTYGGYIKYIYMYGKVYSKNVYNRYIYIYVCFVGDNVIPSNLYQHETNDKTSINLCAELLSQSLQRLVRSYGIWVTVICQNLLRNR